MCQLLRQPNSPSNFLVLICISVVVIGSPSSFAILIGSPSSFAVLIGSPFSYGVQVLLERLMLAVLLLRDPCKRAAVGRIRRQLEG